MARAGFGVGAAGRAGVTCLHAKSVKEDRREGSQR